MPGFHLIRIDFFSFLVALVVSIIMGIFLEPIQVSRKGTIRKVVFLGRSLKNIDGESELMLTIARWRTKCVGTTTEIPESLLIICTTISAYDDERTIKFFFEIFCEEHECK